MSGYDRNIFLSTVFAVLLCFPASGQIEALSEAEIPCDKVFAVHGDVAIGAVHGQYHRKTLSLFDLNTGVIDTTINKKVRTTIEIGSAHYFLLFEGSSLNPGQLYFFKDGQLLLLDDNLPLYDIYLEPTSNALIGSTDQGFVLIDDGEVVNEAELGTRLINIEPYNDGFLAVADSLYYLINENLTTVQAFEIPSGLKSFRGAVLDGILLLRGDINDSNTWPLSLYNIATSNLYSVVDSAGAEAMPNHFAQPIGSYENHFFLAGNGQITSAPFTYTYPTDAGFINLENGIYTPANNRLGLYQTAVQPVMAQASNGPVVFGRMGIEGVEPYAINGHGLDVIKDIYKGFGSSINFDRLFSNYWWSPGTHPTEIEIVEKSGVVYFSARSPHLGSQIWRTDGTDEGTYAVTDFNLADKGFKRCFIGKDDEEVLLTVLHGNGQRLLYRLIENPEPIYPELNTQRNWEVNYATNPLSQGGTIFFDNEHPGVYPAQDGSSVLVLKRTDLWKDHISFNQHFVLPANKIQGLFANTAIQVTNSDGSLRSSAIIRAHQSQERTVGRSYDTGTICAVVSHRPAETWVNENLLSAAQEGHYLIELDDSGREIKSTFLPTGGKNRISISNIEITEDGIYLFGMADGEFDLNGAYTNTITQGNLRAVLLKYNLNHELQWVADSGVDQDIFGSGLQNLVVSDQSAYIVSGGTSYNVWSSCAFSEWPYQISCIDAASGVRKWQRMLNANDVTRITSMTVVDGQWLWVGGYTRGDLSIDNRELDLVANYLSCSYNDFLMCVNAELGTVSYLNHQDPTRAKLVQELRFHQNHLYTLSLVYEEEIFPVPIYGTDGRWNLQLDKYTDGGLKVDSLIWPTTLFRTGFGDKVKAHKFSFDFHPEGGVVLSGLQLANGTLDGFYSPSAAARRYNSNSWLLQRRDIEELETATLPQIATSGGDFQIIPNPVSDNAFVLKVAPQDVDAYQQITLTDIQGRPCMQQNLAGSFESRIIQVNGLLANGVYIVELIGESKRATQKLVLQR